MSDQIHDWVKAAEIALAPPAPAVDTAPPAPTDADHVSAIARSDKALAKAQEVAAAMPFVGAHPTHLVSHVVQRNSVDLNAARQQLRNGTMMMMPAIAEQLKARIVQLADALTKELLPFSSNNEDVRREAFYRAYAASTPGSMINPFKKTRQLQEGDVEGQNGVPYRNIADHPGSRAIEALKAWKARGVRITRSADGASFSLDGSYHAGDVATATELKSEILARLPAPQTI